MLCVIARIDSDSRARLLELQKLTKKLDMPLRNLYGHITLASYTGEDEARFIASCKDILGNYSAFSVRYDRIEVLQATSIIVASPIKETEILSLHADILRAWGEHLDPWSQEAVWHPHTTLVHDPQADLCAAAKVMQDAFVPFRAKVGRIEFSRVQERGYEIVDHIDLPE